MTGGPLWDPAGSHVALGLTVAIQRNGLPSSSHPVGSGLWVVDVANHAGRRVVAGRVGALAWAPKGKSLAYVVMSSSGVPTGIDTVSVAGSKTREIAPLTNRVAGSAPLATTLAWSPDGKTILVCYDEQQGGHAEETGVDVYSLTRGSPTMILPSVPTSTVAYGGAAYAPSGRSLAVAALYDHPSTGGNATASGTTVTIPAVTGGAGQYPPFTERLLDLNTGAPHKPHALATMTRPARLVGWYPG